MIRFDDPGEDVSSFPEAGARASGRVNAFFTNAIAFGTVWALTLLLVMAARALGTGWVGTTAALLVGNLLGIGIARRMGARVTGALLVVTAVAQVAEVAMTLIFGAGAVRGGPAHFAVLLASLLGLAAGAVSRGQPRGWSLGPGTTGPARPPSSGPRQDEVAQRPRLRLHPRRA